jgi:hypothetical protein
MSVTEAITCYGDLAQRVFSDEKLTGRDGKFKASRLEEVLKEIIEEKTGQIDERMMDRRRDGKVCKTYSLSDCFSCCKADQLLASCVPCLQRT